MSPESQIDQQIQQMYAEYSASTPLEPISYEIYAPFARAVLIPLVGIESGLRERFSSCSPSDLRSLRTEYERQVTDLCRQYFESSGIDIDDLELCMRCLSPLPEWLYPVDMTYYHLFLSISGYCYPIMREEEYKYNIRSVYYVQLLFGKLLRGIFCNLDEVKISNLVQRFGFVITGEFRIGREESELASVTI